MVIGTTPFEKFEAYDDSVLFFITSLTMSAIKRLVDFSLTTTLSLSRPFCFDFIFASNTRGNNRNKIKKFHSCQFYPCFESFAANKVTKSYLFVVSCIFALVNKCMIECS